LAPPKGRRARLTRQKAMGKYFVRYGREKRYFEVPSGWKVLTFAVFHDHEGERDPDTLTRIGINSPIRSAPLKERISPADRVAILIEDQTRYSPKKSILGALLKEMEEAGISRERIEVILALGTHRELSTEEMGAVYGEDLVKTYPFFNHNCHAPDLVPVAKLKTGTPVKINPRVHEASFKIGIGSIFPHPMNGFGGGGKILFPGVANFEAILEHHLRYSFRNGSELGKVEGNPFYEDVRELSGAAGLDFIINSVLDHNDRLYDLVCGDPVEAHLAGIEICRGIISQEFPKKADLTIISSFPYTEGTQLMKPLAPASMITREGGVIILVANCLLPLPEAYVAGCESFCMEHGHRLKGGVLDLFDNNRRIMEDGAPELNMSMAQALLAQDEYKVIFVSEEVPREVVERLGFLYAEDLNGAFVMSEKFVTDPEVHIVPSGGVILPVVRGK